MKSPAVVAVLLAALGMAVWFTRRQGEGDARPRPGVVAVAVAGLHSEKASSSTAAEVASRPPVSQEEFDRLVEEWRGHTTGPGKYYIYTHEEYRLADRCVERFGCGEDLIRLMRAVSRQDSGTPEVFHKAVQRYLAEKAGGPERAVVAGITSDAAIRVRWCYYAGAGCLPEDVAALSRLLTSQEDRDAVMLGSALKVAQTDPVAAMKFAAEQLDGRDSRVPLPCKVFEDIVASVKDSAVFPLLEPVAGEVSTDGWNLLVNRWAMEDPPGLIRHINAHPGNFSGDDITAAVVRMTRVEGGRERAFESLQDLTNPEHYDSAVSALIPYLAGSYAKEMTALAEQIQSPAARALALKRIKDHPETMRQLP